VRRFLLSPEKPKTGVRPGSDPGFSIVCQCFGMSERQIEEGLARGEPLACGTNCGSCLPEVRRIAARVGVNARKMVA
jgi:assimilatory nitrate reductase catalytic subunit